MGMEILWFRHLTSAIGRFRVMYSLLLTVILLSMWMGSYIGGLLVRKFQRPTVIFAVSQILFIGTTLMGLLYFDIYELQVFSEKYSNGSFLVSAYWKLFYPIFKLVGIPAIFMGFAFPLANAIAQTQENKVGSCAGKIYLWNSMGAVLGSLSAGFFLIPYLGTKLTVLILISVAILGVIPLIYLGFNSFKISRSNAVPAFMLCLCSFGVALLTVQFTRVGHDFFILKTFRSFSGYLPKNEKPDILSIKEGPNESLVVIRNKDKETGLPYNTLFTDGHSMSSTHSTSQRYMRAFSHIPLIHVKEPKNALVICFGVGTTLHAASLHSSLENIELVDLSKNVLNHAGFFSSSNKNVMNDARLKVFVNDGRLHLRMQKPGKYDLVTLEPPPIQFAGMSALYSKEFYALAKSRLKNGGYFTQWFPLGQLPGEAIQAMLKSFVEVFPESIFLEIDSSNYMMMGKKGSPIQLQESFIKNFLATNNPVTQDLKHIKLGSIKELASTFRSNGQVLLKALSNIKPITDDLPKMEYAILIYDHAKLPTSMLNVSMGRHWIVRK